MLVRNMACVRLGGAQGIGLRVNGDIVRLRQDPAGALTQDFWRLQRSA